MKKLIVVLVVLFAFILQSCIVHQNHRPQNKVVYVKQVPKSHKIVVIKGKRYYYFNGKHHRKTKRGYVVVKF